MKREWNENSHSSAEDNSTPYKRCVWSQEEDNLLRKLANNVQRPDWNHIANAIASRVHKGKYSKSAKQCRERWHNRVNPIIKCEPWTPAEDNCFFQLHKELGPKWSEIAISLPGRTDNSVKNYFFCKLRKLSRRITNNTISDEMKSSQQEIEHTNYLIDHILANYMDDEDKKSVQRDKYVVNILRKNSITKERIAKYSKKFLESSIEASKGIRTIELYHSEGESLDLVLPIKKLPVISKDLEIKTGNGSELVNKEKLFSQLKDSQVRSQLEFLHMRNLCKKELNLPLPKTFFPPYTSFKDIITPVFCFEKNAKKTSFQSPTKFENSKKILGIQKRINLIASKMRSGSAFTSLNHRDAK